MIIAAKDKQKPSPVQKIKPVYLHKGLKEANSHIA